MKTLKNYFKKKETLKIKFKHYKNSDFVIWFFISIILLIIIFDITSLLYKYFILFALVVLALFGFLETFERIESKGIEESMKQVQIFKILILKDFIKFFFWLFGILAILYGFLFILFFPNIISDPRLFTLITIGSIIFLAVGSLLALAGFFLRAIKEEIPTFSKFSGFFKNIGLGVIIFAVFFLSFTLIMDDIFLIKIIFYSSILMGCGLLLIDSLFRKYKSSTIILSFILGIIALIFVIDLFQPTSFYFERFLHKFPIFKINIRFHTILLIIERISFVSVIALGIYFILDYSDLKQNKFERKKEIIKTSTFISLTLWICSMSLLMIFYPSLY